MYLVFVFTLFTLLTFAFGDYTFQTSPSSGQVVTTSAGLPVRWQIQTGNSPDSNSPAPALLTVSIGYKDASGNPQYGTITSSPAPADERSVMFSDVQGLPALTATSQFFIIISDQTTGYRSNGQIFAILDTGSGLASSAPAASVPVPAVPTSSKTAAATATAAPTPAAAVKPPAGPPTLPKQGTASPTAGPAKPPASAATVTDSNSSLPIIPVPSSSPTAAAASTPVVTSSRTSESELQASTTTGTLILAVVIGAVLGVGCPF